MPQLFFPAHFYASQLQTPPVSNGSFVLAFVSFGMQKFSLASIVVNRIMFIFVICLCFTDLETTASINTHCISSSNSMHQ